MALHARYLRTVRYQLNPAIKGFRQQLISNYRSNSTLECMNRAHRRNNIHEKIRYFTSSSQDNGNAIAPITISKDFSNTIVKIQSLEISGENDEEKQLQISRILQSNVLALAIELLQSDDSTDMEWLPTYLSLIPLSSEQTIARELARLGIIPVLGRHLKHESLRIQAASCALLGQLALEPQAAQQISFSSQTVGNLFHLGTNTTLSLSIRHAAVSCIANIAGVPAGRDQLCNPETIQELSTLLVSLDIGKDENINRFTSSVAFVLGNLASGGDIWTQDELQKSGALASLILLLSPVYPDSISSAAAWAIHHIVRLHTENQAMVQQSGGIHLLMQLILKKNKDTNTESLTNAILALDSSLLGNEENIQYCRHHTDFMTLQNLQITSNAHAKAAMTQLLQTLT